MARLPMAKFIPDKWQNTILPSANIVPAAHALETERAASLCSSFRSAGLFRFVLRCVLFCRFVCHAQFWVQTPAAHGVPRQAVFPRKALITVCPLLVLSYNFQFQLHAVSFSSHSMFPIPCSSGYFIRTARFSAINSQKIFYQYSNRVHIYYRIMYGLSTAVSGHRCFYNRTGKNRPIRAQTRRKFQSATYHFYITVVLLCNKLAPCGAIGKYHAGSNIKYR